MKKSILLTGFICSVFAVQAQDSLKPRGRWSFLVEPYLMFPNMKGQSGIGNLPDVDVDADIGDIFSKLQMGAMLYMEANSDQWSLSSDLIYMKLEQDVQSNMLIRNGKVTAKQFAWELAGLRQVTPWLEAGIGGILNSISTELNIDVKNIGGGTTNQKRTFSKTWVDPMIIVRVKSAEGKKWMYLLRGEAGGFGIGSDFAWQVQAYFGYRFSRLFQLTGGYRVISMDYQTGDGEGRFKYDMDTFGPVIRLGFNF